MNEYLIGIPGLMDGERQHDIPVQLYKLRKVTLDKYNTNEFTYLSPENNPIIPFIPYKVLDVIGAYKDNVLTKFYESYFIGQLIFVLDSFYNEKYLFKARSDEDALKIFEIYVGKKLLSTTTRLFAMPKYRVRYHLNKEFLVYSPDLKINKKNGFDTLISAISSFRNLYKINSFNTQYFSETKRADSKVFEFSRHIASFKDFKTWVSIIEHIFGYQRLTYKDGNFYDSYATAMYLDIDDVKTDDIKITSVNSEEEKSLSDIPEFLLEDDLFLPQTNFSISDIDMSDIPAKNRERNYSSGDAVFDNLLEIILSEKYSLMDASSFTIITNNINKRFISDNIKIMPLFNDPSTPKLKKGKFIKLIDALDIKEIKE